MTAITEDGTLDEALQRVHSTGPELSQGWLSNHAPMAVEALARHGQARTVHRWLDAYRHRTDELPSAALTITDDNWREALGDPRHLGSWIAHFTRLTAELPWTDVLTAWWPRLLPGIIAGATHPVIRVGHAVRTLLTDGETEPRTAELAHALGYWAARHQPLPVTVTPSGGAGPHRALDAVPSLAVQEGGVLDRLARLPAAEGWPAAASGLRRPAGPDDARDLLTELVRATVARYPRYAHGDAVMLVHAATAPNAVLRVLPALPRALWVPSLTAAWEASAVLTAAYAPARPVFPAAPGVTTTMEESFALAAAHGDAHVIKLADTAWDVGGPAALAATARACELIEPGDG